MPLLEGTWLFAVEEELTRACLPKMMDCWTLTICQPDPDCFWWYPRLLMGLLLRLASQQQASQMLMLPSLSLCCCLLTAWQPANDTVMSCLQLQAHLASFRDLQYCKTDLIAAKGVVFCKYAKSSSALAALEAINETGMVSQVALHVSPECLNQLLSRQPASQMYHFP